MSMTQFKLLVLHNANMQCHTMYKLRERKVKTNVANATGEYAHANAKSIQNQRETCACVTRGAIKTACTSCSRLSR